MATAAPPRDVSRMTLDEVTAELSELTGRAAKAFREARDDSGNIDTSAIEILEGDERSKSVQLAEMHERMKALGGRRDELASIEKIAADVDREEKWLEDVLRPAGVAPSGQGERQPAPSSKSIALRMAEHEVIRKYGGSGSGPSGEIELSPLEIKALVQGGQKTVMSTGAGWAPESIRTPGSTLAGREESYVQDFIPVVPISQAAYVFMQQTTRTNNAAEAAESADGALVSAAESAFAWTEVTETLRKITHFLPVTREQLADVAGLEADLDAEMIAGIRERLSGQILVGTGTAPQIEGFLDAGRASVNTVARGTDDRFTAIHNGMTTNRVTGFASADGIIMHPNDWHDIRTTQTADGVFILGPPSMADSMNLWGLPVLTTTDITENTVLLGAFARFARVAVMGSIEVAASDSHASYFIQGVRAIRAELRATLAVLREDAFTTVTSM